MIESITATAINVTVTYVVPGVVLGSIITKSLVVGTLKLSLIPVKWGMRRVEGSTGIALFPSAVDNPTLRILQRLLISQTRKNTSVTWYPLEDFTDVNPTRTDNNGHAVAGATRDAARTLITTAVSAAGFRHYEISPAHASTFAEAMSHQYFAVGDLARETAYDPPRRGDAVVVIDTDYYIENFDDLFTLDIPFVAYTFQPLKVSGPDGDCSFTITNNRVNYIVSGGGNWKHQIWDWNVAGEFLVAPDSLRSWKDWLLSFVGIRKNHYHKLQHARPWPTLPNRSIVWTVPQFTTYEFTWIKNDIAARRLTRMKYSDELRPGWNSIVSTTPTGENWISLGREGEDAELSMRKSDYDTLMGLNSGQSVSSRMISLYNQRKEQTDFRALALMGQYFKGGVHEPIVHQVMMNPAIPKIHRPPTIVDDDIKISPRRYASGVMTMEALVPIIRRWEVISASIHNRVTAVANNKPPMYKYGEYATAFLHALIPVPHIGQPYGLEETVVLLNKPSQTLGIRNIWETVDMSPRRLVEAFPKNEPGTKDARIISSFPDMRYLLHLSRFTLACRDNLLHHTDNANWFFPGATPKEIAERVVQFCDQNGAVSETDFSNFDGSISAWLQRKVMNAVYLRYFDTQWHNELRPYLNMLVTCPSGSKTFGFRYNSGVGVKSGSPTTCDANTIANCFVEFCALARKYPEMYKNGFHRQLLQMVGPKFGDDGLCPTIVAHQFNKVSNDLGLTVKIENCNEDTGVTFLARVYPRPSESTTSFQDPLRTWMKLHLTTRDPSIPLADAAIDRLTGYIITDRLTPITSDYAKRVMKLHEDKASLASIRQARKSYEIDRPYWSISIDASQSWPQNADDIDQIWSVMAHRTGFDIETLKAYQSYLQTTEETNPFQLKSLNSDEATVPYRNTIDPDDHLPTDDAVGPRFSEIQDVTIKQVDSQPPQPAGEAGPSSHGRCSGAADTRARPERGQGPYRPPRGSQRNAPAFGQHHRIIDDEAQGPTAARNSDPYYQPSGQRGRGRQNHRGAYNQARRGRSRAR